MAADARNIMSSTEIMNELPLEFEPEKVGLSTAEIVRVQALRRRKTHAVYRLILRKGSLVLKWFATGHSKELKCYEFFRRHGIPTLLVLGSSDGALLIEDLESSELWRPATPDDSRSAEFGAALAEWYKCLHRVGLETVGNPDLRPDFLEDWVTGLDRERLKLVGAKFGIANRRSWQCAVKNIERLRCAFRDLRQTINYNDFYWGNAAVSRKGTSPEVLVFDYDCVVIGPAYTDYRNVSSSLYGKARASFQNAYGQVDEREAAVDEPLSFIYAISCAADREQLPKWAQACLAKVEDGSLAVSIDRALAALC